MGDRLVSKISYNGEFFAASYQHWAASDDEKLAEILDDVLLEHDFFGENHQRTKEEAAQILYEMLDKYNNQIAVPGHENKGFGLVTPDWKVDEQPNFHSVIQEEFNKNSNLPLGKDRSDGLITVDKEIADDWESWAESLNNFDWS